MASLELRALIVGSRALPRVNGREIFADDEIQAFHMINRCVRRTFLCGMDRKTGRDFSHRKQWIRDRLEVLAGIFAVDELGFAVLSNHLHVVVRTRPDVVKTWSDAEIAERWWNVFPQRREKNGSPAEPTEPELSHISNDASGMKESGAEFPQAFPDRSWLSQVPAVCQLRPPFWTPGKFFCTG